MVLKSLSSTEIRTSDPLLNKVYSLSDLTTQRHEDIITTNVETIIGERLNVSGIFSGLYYHPKNKGILTLKLQLKWLRHYGGIRVQTNKQTWRHFSIGMMAKIMYGMSAPLHTWYHITKIHLLNSCYQITLNFLQINFKGGKWLEQQLKVVKNNVFHILIWLIIQAT